MCAIESIGKMKARNLQVLPGIKAGLIMGCILLDRDHVSDDAASSLPLQHTQQAVEECMFNSPVTHKWVWMCMYTNRSQAE